MIGDKQKRTAVSKYMSYVLRHGAAKEGIAMASDGTVLLADLLAQPKMKGISAEDVYDVVATCSKQRFQLTDGKARIRASQGHSIASVKDSELLTPVVDAALYPVVVHGTTTAAARIIRVEGLNRMKRKHIHFATGLPGADGVVSGMRQSSNALVFLNLTKCLEDKIPFFVSANGVLLSPGIGKTGTIPPRYFSKIEDK